MKIENIIKEVVGKTTKTLYEGCNDNDIWGIENAIAKIHKYILKELKKIQRPHKQCIENSKKSTSHRSCWCINDFVEAIDEMERKFNVTAFIRSKK